MFRNPLTDSIVVLIVLLLIFGPKRLPALGKSLGEGMREFKDSITGGSSSDDEDEPASLNEATVTETAPPAPQAPPPPAQQAPLPPQQPTAGAPPPETPAPAADEPDSAAVGSSEPRA